MTRRSQVMPGLLLAAVLALPAQAQRVGPRGVPQAFAVVQAPDGVVEACHATSARAAHDCAQAKCQRKAGRGACFGVTACAPSGWAGIMGIKLKQAHLSQSVCGGPTQEALVDALKAFCKGHIAQLEQCSLSLVWGPDGKPQALSHVWMPNDLTR